jgi:hypothetical protein
VHATSAPVADGASGALSPRPATQIFRAPEESTESAPVPPEIYARGGVVVHEGQRHNPVGVDVTFTTLLDVLEVAVVMSDAAEPRGRCSFDSPADVAAVLQALEWRLR